MTAPAECRFCGCVGTHEPLCLGAVEVDPPMEARPIRGGRGTRETSKAAYHALERSGRLGEQQRIIYELVRDHGPLTQFETYVKMEELTGTPALSLRSSRHSELVRKGWLREVGTRMNPSGRPAILYAAVLPQERAA